MARTDDDSWDLASSVGVTATMVASARALATQRDDPLVDDPFADPLVRAVGLDTFTRVLDGETALDDPDGVGLLIDMIAVRTKFFDDSFADAGRAGVRQAVSLASGLDSRAYRLAWPLGTRVFEIDLPEVLAFKSGVLADVGAEPAADLRTVAVDLRDDWPAALASAGFDASVPTAWIAEGLLIYLPPGAQERLFDFIDRLSAPGSRIATEYHPDGGAGIAARSSSMSAQLASQGLHLNLGELFYQGRRRAVTDQLAELGWELSTLPRPEMFARYGRTFPEGPAGEPLRTSVFVTAVKEQ
jgi:methyltransferase (TIGR00027 family)